MPEETTSFAPVKDWARRSLPPENELRDAILSEEHDVLPRWEALVKLDVYSRMLDAKAKRMGIQVHQPRRLRTAHTLRILDWIQSH